MNVKSEIADRIERLSPELQEQVLQYVNSLTRSSVTGERGADLRQFAGLLDPVSADEIKRAIEGECERIDATGW